MRITYLRRLFVLHSDFKRNLNSVVLFDDGEISVSGYSRVLTRATARRLAKALLKYAEGGK